MSAQDGKGRVGAKTMAGEIGSAWLVKATVCARLAAISSGVVSSPGQSADEPNHIILVSECRVGARTIWWLVDG